MFSGKQAKSSSGNSKEDLSSSDNVFPNSDIANAEGDLVDSGATGKKCESPVHMDGGSSLEKKMSKDVDETSTKEVEEEEVELDNLFFEDSSAWEAVAPEILKQQKIEKLSHDGYGHLLGNIDDIWKKVMCICTTLY